MNGFIKVLGEEMKLPLSTFAPKWRNEFLMCPNLFHLMNGVLILSVFLPIFVTSTCFFFVRLVYEVKIVHGMLDISSGNLHSWICHPVCLLSLFTNFPMIIDFKCVCLLPLSILNLIKALWCLNICLHHQRLQISMFSPVQLSRSFIQGQNGGPVRWQMLPPVEPCC